ncbi:MAG: DNA polymerase III subunit beta [Patescibacteria group bacterium]
MKFTCTQENLTTALNAVSHITGKTTTLPILKNLLITAEADGITLSTTNLEIGMTTHVRGKVEVPGSFTVQARLLHEYLSLLGSGNVTCALQEADLHISSSASKTVLKGLPAEDFPVIPKVQGGVSIVLPAKVCKTALNQVVFAVAADDARPELNGVFMRLQGQVLTLAATDSFRLAEVTIPLPTSKEEQSVILPSRTMQELNRILPETDDVVIRLSESQVSFVVGDTELVSRLIEGQFPDYTQIIPESFTTSCTVETSAFAKVVRQVSLFCKAGINDVTLTYDTDGKQLHLNAANAQVGTSETDLDVQVQGKGGSIVFNWRYLLDGVNALQTEECLLELNDEKGPGLILPKQTGKGQATYRYLLMPIRQ